MVGSAGQGRVTSNFALTHFAAAKLFAGKVGEIEAAHVGQPFGNFWQEISIYCASCIIEAAASHEALINELFIAPGPLSQSVSDFDKFFWGGDEIRRHLFFFRYTKRVYGLERKPALMKYKKAMSILNKSPLSRTEGLYQDAEALIGFRNYLIHFKPLWDDERRQDRLEDKLNGKFEFSPYPDDGAEFLAKKCMSAGCARWAIRTVAEFVQDFAQRSELDPRKLGMFEI